MGEKEGYELVENIKNVLEFLTEDEVRGALLGTLAYHELMSPGYTDSLVLKIIYARENPDHEEEE